MGFFCPLFYALLEIQHIITHTLYDYLCYGYFGYFGCQCSTIEKSPREGLKIGGYALDLNK